MTKRRNRTSTCFPPVGLAVLYAEGFEGVSGSHTFAVYIKLSGQLQPHFQVLMGLGWDELKLKNPGRPGDALDLEMTVLELRPSKSKPDWGIVRNKNLLRNQKRETVLQCISTIFVARRPGADAPGAS